MLKPRSGLNESRPALPGAIGPLRRAAVEFAAEAGADDLQQENIALAMSEAISNSVIHAYPADSVGLVTVQAWSAGDRIVVVVCDDGCGMIPRYDSPGLGLGLPIIARVTERVEIENPAPRSGVRLRMTFPLRGD